MQSSPFNPYAADYDAEFTTTPLGRTLRGMVWSRLDYVFTPGQRVLELGCGTGEDAMRLAQRGVDVLATDAAEGMIAVARRKAAGRDLSGRIEFKAMPMEGIADLKVDRKFDGVFSNFGAVNCARDLKILVKDVAALLNPDAPLLWVVMGKHVPWEWIWYLTRMQAGKAFRRYRKGGVEWRGMRVKYPTPAELRRTLSPHFRVNRVTALGCILPPSYAAGWLNRRPRALQTLTRLESLAQRSFRLASCADHYMIEAVLEPRA